MLTTIFEHRKRSLSAWRRIRLPGKRPGSWKSRNHLTSTLRRPTGRQLS